jgi:lipoprotein-anchoring transpeptidase ErfK/SrfK
MATGRHVARRRTRAAIIVAVIVGVLLLALGGAAWAAFRYERANENRILPGVRIAGVDVSGMTRHEARDTVLRDAQTVLTAPLTVIAGDERYVVTPAQLGKRADVRAAVDRALAAGEDMGTLDRFWHRFRHESIGVDLELSYGVHGLAVGELVAQIAKDVAVTPRDASIGVTDDLSDIRFIHAREGQRLAEAKAATAIQDALATGDSKVRLHLASVRPKVPDAELGHTIVVRLNENRLYLYDGFRVEKSYSVATAKPGFTTPDGLWTIWDKRVDPTWYNPALDTWGANLPAVIPGGPGNPMGPRAIYIDAPGLIRIHGTSDDASIGRYASHGCIRLHNEDVIDLFDRIEVGEHVLVVGSRPADAGYWSVPPASDI